MLNFLLNYLQNQGAASHRVALHLIWKWQQQQQQLPYSDETNCLEHIRVARHDARCLSRIASRHWNQLQIGIGVEGSGCGGGGGKDDDVIIIEQVSSGDL